DVMVRVFPYSFLAVLLVCGFSANASDADSPSGATEAVSCSAEMSSSEDLGAADESVASSSGSIEHSGVSDFLAKFRRAVENFEVNIQSPSNLNKAERDAFERAGIRVLNRLEKSTNVHFGFSLWVPIEAKVFPWAEMEESANIKEFQEIFEQLAMAMRHYGRPEDLLKGTKRTSSRIHSLEKLHRLMRAYSTFYFELFGEDLDLTTPVGLHELFEVENPTERVPQDLPARVRTLMLANSQLNARIAGDLEQSHGYHVSAFLSRHFFGRSSVGILENDRGFFTNHGGQAEILLLLNSLPLSEEQLNEAEYKLEQLQELEDPVYRNFSSVLLFYYYLQWAGERAIDAMIEDNPHALRTKEGFL
ncbi:MAG: hypothetical protein AAF202_13525, partial [Pseudomonadota bacterium]